MSEVEKLEAVYRALATKLIYASFDNEIDPEALAELDRLGGQLSRMNSADFSHGEARQAAFG